MFDIKKVADRVFDTLRSFNYEVAMFDEEGAWCYEPADAVRFFADKKNLTVSIESEGENSILNVAMGKSVEISSVRSLLDKLRATATKFGLSFTPRKYKREITPKDYAHGKVLEGLEGSTKSSYLKLEGARMIIRHATAVDENKHGARARNVKKIMVENSDGERFLMPSINLAAGRAMTRHVSKGGHWSDENGQKLAEMAKEQTQLRNCVSYCRKNSRKLDEDASIIIETCANKVRETRNVFKGIYENYDKNISSLQKEGDVLLNEDDETFNQRVDALCEKLQLEEDSVIDRSTCETVARAMTGKALTEKKQDMMMVPNFDMEVEVAAWQSLFADPSVINVTGPVEFQKGMNIPAALQALADKIADDGLSNLASRIADDILHGQKTATLTGMAKKFISAQRNVVGATQEVDEEIGSENMIELPAFGLSVETSAWDALKNGQIALSAPVAVSGDEKVAQLQAIAQNCTAPKFGELLNRIADDFDLGRAKPIHIAVANAAIKAALNSKAEALSESVLIKTPSIRAFGKWFDGMSPATMFESMDTGPQPRYMGDDDLAGARETALQQAVDAFNVEDFLVMRGDDFNYGDNDIDAQVDASSLLTSIEHYLRDEAGAFLGDMAQTGAGAGEDLGDVSKIAHDLLGEVISKLESESYTVTGQEALEADEIDGTDVDGMVSSEDELDEADVEGEDGLDDNEQVLLGGLDSEELEPEDVLLPRNPAADLAHDVEADTDSDELNRMLTLAGMKRSTGPQVRTQ